MRTVKKGLVFYSLLSIVILSVYATYLWAIPKTVSISRTENGFIPAKILIHKGDSVQFVNNSQTDIWPASDSHPTHGIYSEFDPKRPIPAGESWTFTFNKAGVWTYHDHLLSEILGTIIVIGAPGETSKECLAHTTDSVAAAVCWEGEITDVLEKDGLDAAFKRFSEIYAQEPLFRGQNCHDVTHIIGAAAYQLYSDNRSVIDESEVSYCGYGFYHGFIETMLVDEGPGNFKKVVDYCNTLKGGGRSNNASAACFHGIGHAAFDSIPGKLWGDDATMVQYALDTCNKALTGESERALCGTGVFNSLANAASRHSYSLSFPKSDRFHICQIQPMVYQPGCYSEFGIGLIREEYMSRTESLRLIESIPSIDGAAAALLGYASDETIRSVRSLNLPDLYNMCTSFSSEKMNSTCMRGVAEGLRLAGEPGKEYIPVISYCAFYPLGATRDTCCTVATYLMRESPSDTKEVLGQCSRASQSQP